MAKVPTTKNANGSNGGGSDTQILSVVGLAELFALPLTALVDADVYGSQAFLSFLKEFAFEPMPNGNPDDFGKLRTVTFFYTANGPGGVPQKMRVEVPWISLVPLPLLSIRDAHMEFEVEVVGITDSSQKTAQTADIPGPVRMAKVDNVRKASAQKRQLTARLFKTSGSAIAVNQSTSKPGRTFGPPKKSSRTSEQKTGSNPQEEVKSRVNMYVEMNMIQSDLPMGIIQLLNLTQQGTMEQTLNGPSMALTTTNGTPKVSRLGDKIEVVVRLFDASGKPGADTEVLITQDADPYFSPDTATVFSDADGLAYVTFKLIKTAVGQPVIKSIFANAPMEAPGFANIDVSAKLDIQIAPLQSKT